MNDEIMKKKKAGHVCPLEIAGMLDGKLRRWVHNPAKILAPFISEGMTVLDVGCGPGFFSIEMARMAGPDGSVIAADLQPGMLQKVEHKINGSEIENRILLHQCREDAIGISHPVQPDRDIDTGIAVTALLRRSNANSAALNSLITCCAVCPPPIITGVFRENVNEILAFR